MRAPWHDLAEAFLLPLLALAGALLLFGAFVWVGGHDPVEAWTLLFVGAFGDAFSWQNTLQRAAPLMLTALTVALPARAGLVIIGGEGALVLGGLAAAGMPYLLPSLAGTGGTVVLLLAAAVAGGAWIALAGALRQWRGVNETISSLLLGYIAIALFKHWVEGALRDPASLNKPSTLPLAESSRLQQLQYLLRNSLVDIRWVPDTAAMSILSHRTLEFLGMPVVELNHPASHGIQGLPKEIFDRLFALLVLLMLLPLLLTLAALIKRSSPGPVLFRQPRLGLNGRVFHVYKFRSMKLHREGGNKVTQASRDDPRG